MLAVVAPAGCTQAWPREAVPPWLRVAQEPRPHAEDLTLVAAKSIKMDETEGRQTKGHDGGWEGAQGGGWNRKKGGDQGHRMHYMWRKRIKEGGL